MTNAETRLTKIVREYLEERGAHCIKISDRFTRGIPDLLVTANRIIMIEMKIDPGLDDQCRTATYGQLGMSGAQDHHVRQIFRRTPGASCCITGRVDGTGLRLWEPVSAHLETVPDYRCVSFDWHVYNWILGTPGADRRPR